MESRTTMISLGDSSSDIAANDEKSDTMTDPLSLPGPAVDLILKLIDDRSLLKARWMNRSWNKQIVNSNKLWKCRLQQNLYFRPEAENTENAADDSESKDYFRQYLRMLHAYSCIQSGKAFHNGWYTGSHCLYTTYNKMHNLPIAFDIAYLPMFVYSKQITAHPNSRKVVIVNSYGMLALVDLMDLRLVWGNSALGPQMVDSHPACPTDLFAVTKNGNVAIVSMEDGQPSVHIDCGGRLQHVQQMCVCPDGRFLLVALDDNTVFLVSVEERKAFQLPLSFPKEAEPATAMDPRFKKQLQFLNNEGLGAEKMMVRVFRRNCVVVAVVTKRGRVLGQDCKTFDWLSPYIPAESLHQHFIVRTEDTLEKVCVVLGASPDAGGYGGMVELRVERQREIPDRLRHGAVQPALCGESYMVGFHYHKLFVCCLSTGRMLTSALFDECTEPDPSQCRLGHAHELCTPSGLSCTCEVMVEELELSQVNVVRMATWAAWANREVVTPAVFFTSLQWLDGLRASFTKDHSRPLVVIVSDRGKKMRCVRWSEELWKDLDSHTETESDHAPGCHVQ